MPVTNVLVSAILVALAFVAYRLLFVGGIAYSGRLKCVPPTQAWIRLPTDSDSATRIRVALSFFLASRRANPAPIESMRLSVQAGDRSVEFPLTRLADFGGRQLPGGVPVRVLSDSAAEVVAEFSNDHPEVGRLLLDKASDPKGTLFVTIVGARLEPSVASFGLARVWPLDETQEWQPLETQ